MPATTPCKVCTALDTLPDEDAEWLDQHLADPAWTKQALADLLTSYDYPISRNSVSRHIRGRCSLGLQYRKAA